MIHYRNDVLQAIAEINQKWRKPTPQCYLVALLLASQFQGEIWYDSNHCLTKIDGVFYDKTGIVFMKDQTTTFLRLDEFGLNIKQALVEALINKHK